MLDPVSAIGVAATALQFLTFSLDALDLCLEIRDAGEGASKANRELEIATKDITAIAKELNTATKNNDRIGRRINRIAAECVTSSDELVKLLEQVRGAGRSKAIGPAKATFKALKANKRIEKLKNAIEEKKTSLDTALTHDIRNRVDLLAIEQSKEFLNLDDRIKELLKQLQSQQAESKASALSLEQSLAHVSTQSKEIRNAVGKAEHNVRQDIVGLASQVERRFDVLSLKNSRDELLTSLFYPEHEARKDMIKPTWPRTFEWVIEEADFAARDERCLWSNFPKWLRGEGGLYWISGKLASGKSTLMAYLLNEPSTEANLNTWTSGKPVYILSFFFWRPGSQLQKSVQGLLRSLLSQLLEQVPDQVVEEILQEHPVPFGRIPSWTERKLKKMLGSALRAVSAIHRHICLFIDGLDEVEGETEELLQLVVDFQHFKGVKCCVSSRPETELRLALSKHAHLQLEDLNQKDISEYVHGKLDESGHDSAFFHELGRKISWRAQGIFLWAVLVTQSVLRGANAGDDEIILHERLNDTPSGMDALFTKMLTGIDKVHKKSLAFYLRAMRLLERIPWMNPNIILLAASQSRHDPAHYSQFVVACKQTQDQICAHSKGLLETHRPKSYAESDERLWALPQHRHSLRALSSKTLTGRQEIMCSRKPDVQDWSKRQLITQLFAYERTWVSWVHRSAYDFLFAEELDLVRNLLNVVTDSQVARDLADGSMKLLVSYPTIGRDEHESVYRTLEGQFGKTVDRILCMMSELGGSVVEYLAEMKDLIERTRLEEIRDSCVSKNATAPSHHYIEFQETRPEECFRDVLRTSLWQGCVRFECFTYCRTHFWEIFHYGEGPNVLADMIANVTFHRQLSNLETRERIEFITDGLEILRQSYLNPLHNTSIERDSPLEVAMLETGACFFGEEIYISWNSFHPINSTYQTWLEAGLVGGLLFTLDTCTDRYLRPEVSHKGADQEPHAGLRSLIRMLVSLLGSWNVYVDLENPNVGESYNRESLLHGNFVTKEVGKAEVLSTSTDGNEQSLVDISKNYESCSGEMGDDGHGGSEASGEQESDELDEESAQEETDSDADLSNMRPRLRHLVLQMPIQRYLQHFVVPRLPTASQDAFREALGSIEPCFRLLYQVERPRNIDVMGYTLPKRCPVDSVEAAYQLDPSNGEQILESSAAEIESMMEDWKRRIELHPKQPEGLVKVPCKRYMKGNVTQLLSDSHTRACAGDT